MRANKNKKIFKAVKIGDKVWSNEYGPGIISNTNYDIHFPIVAEFNGLKVHGFDLYGTQEGEDTQTLFYIL